MDTQLTLVDYAAPFPEREADSVLTFSRDSLLDSTLSLQGTNSVVYTIQTTPATELTTIRRYVPGSVEDPFVVVKIERNDFLSDQVTFGDLPRMKTNKWLKKRSFCDPRACDVEGAPRYVWKPTNAREIALYHDVSSLSSLIPIAWFRSSFGTGEPATLSLQPETRDIQDAVLASLIIVEQRYRVKDKRANVAASGRGIPSV
ncbi:hypothetical protein K474DRAFT_1665128 [Panus rudis PR-1116 ss-1]|nr:hypothetical protein K474DRAFT_1665128 [Panus rudis PR-1116 ss-1]